MASVGDLDHNGFNGKWFGDKRLHFFQNYYQLTDVAIGAPYENEHRGSVYIYQSSSKGLKLSQVIDRFFKI